MAKLSPEDAATLKRLQARQQAADDEDELVIWVRNSDGHETRLTGDRAEAWCRRHGYTAEEAEESTKSEPLEGADAAAAAKKPAAKKPAAKKPAEAGDVEADGVEADDVEADAAPASTRRRSFF